MVNMSFQKEVSIILNKHQDFILFIEDNYLLSILTYKWSWISIVDFVHVGPHQLYSFQFLTYCK